MYGTPPPGQQSYYYPTSTTAPEWQQPVSAGQPWQGHGHTSTAPPPPPPPPPPPHPSSQPGGSDYNPATYGQMRQTPPLIDPNTPTGAHSGGLDTSHWGVKYNQQQQQYQHQSSLGQMPSSGPPPLPPRPGSSLDQSQPHSSPLQAPAWTTSVSPQTQQQPYYPHGHHPTQSDYSQQWPTQPYADPNYGASQPIPPPPPPLPPAYQSEVQQQQQLQQQQQQFQQAQQPPGWPAPTTYPEQPPAYQYAYPQNHQYDSAHQQVVSGPQGAPGHVEHSNQGYMQPPSVTHEHIHSPPPSTAPVPPPTTSPGTNMSSQHVSPIVAQVAPVASQPTTSVTGASALGTGNPSDWEHFTPAGKDVDDTETFKSKPFSELPSDPKPKSTESQQQTIPAPTGSGHIQRSDSAHSNGPKHQPLYNQQSPKRTNSVASSAISPEGIIDGVIEEWARSGSAEVKPLSHKLQQKEHTRTSTASSLADQPRVATPASSQAQLTPQQSPAATSSKIETPAPPSVVTIVDPYEDLDPWYKSSLTRYVTMLRKEMGTDSEEEKFKLFTAFMTKESKLREILYNIENVPATGAHSKAEDESAAPQSLNTVRVDAPASAMDDVLTYSPGGRPIFGSSPPHTQFGRTADDPLHRSASHPTRPAQRNREDSLAPPGGPGSAGSLETHSRSTSVPPPVEKETVRPAYTPFRYTEGPQRGSETLTFDRPAHQAYSALRLASAESGRVMAQPTGQSADSESTDTPSKTKRGQHEFVGLVREKSVAYRLHGPAASLSSRSTTADPLKRGIASVILDELRTLTPPSLPNPADDMQIVTIRKELDKFADDFVFISKSLEAWDRGAPTRGEAIDKQRRHRQEESEHHIDALFHDKEIGYSDINVLEDEFKQTEAQKQLNEERKDFDKFVEIVYNRVDERLESEIARLQKQYDQAVKLLDGEQQDAQNGSSNLSKFQPSHAMKAAADAFKKLEVRHEKRLEAVLERERRKKKAERRYYAFLGDSAALTKMDKDFENREKRILLDAAKGKDQRANQLMDHFDEASMRGIGENQRLLDDISAKVEKLDQGLMSSMGDVASRAQQTLQATLGFVDFLGVDSETILRSFGVADRVLNDADYELSVSEAKVAISSADIFRRLEEEKKKEDTKIEEDLESRISSLKKGYQETIAGIQKALGYIQNPDSQTHPSNSTPNQPPAEPAMPPVPEESPPTPHTSPPTVSAEDERQERLRKALEDAKKRNAARGVPS